MMRTSTGGRCIVLSATFLAAVALGGCVESATTACADLVCPANKQCDEPSGTCVFSEQRPACDGRADGDSCSFPGSSSAICAAGLCVDVVCGDGIVEPGEACDDGNLDDGDGCSATCDSDESCGNGTVDAPREQCDDGNLDDGDGCQSTCLLPRCGDAVTDPGEVCDDGNLVDGDGCNAVCTSDEVCGNGWTDFPLGEQCDDGDFASRDGCTSQCTAELPLWSEFEFSPLGGGRNSGLAYDIARRRLIMFSGSGPIGEPLPLTLEFAANSWLRLALRAQPPGRQRHALVYDAARREVVLFGGLEAIQGGPGVPPPDVTPAFGDTWVFDGAWTRQTPATSPPARGAMGSTYDAARQRIVIFGGQDTDGNVLGDTWTFDGAAWTQVATAGPAPRTDPVMAYDAARERTVLFGGFDGDGLALTDTWEWDGAAWDEVTSATTVPTANGDAVYHAGLARVVLFGGRRDADGTTWEYDGVDWSENIAPGPPARSAARLAYDPATDVVVLTGGADRRVGPGFSDTWRYDADGWTQVQLAPLPPARAEARMAYDSLRGRLLYFGGRVQGPGTPPLLDLWDVVENGFVEIDDINAPEPEAFDRLQDFVYDAGRAVFVATISDGTTDFSTFELTGRTWRRVDTANAPPPRLLSKMVYDDRRGVVLLFGGETGNARRNDHWEYDGSDWREVTPTTRPSPRANPMMAYDRARQRTVLFGGRVGPGRGDDTWVYDGTNWQQLAPETSPSPRSGTGLVFFPPRGTVHLYAGEPGPLDDNWELVGDEWVRLQVPVRPGPRPFPGLGVDGRDRVITLVAGESREDLHRFTFSSTVPDERCFDGTDDDGDGLADCDDPDCNGRSCGGSALVCLEGACACGGGDTESVCGDEFDDDCDGLVDCADPDCASSVECIAEASCTDGGDDDGDGRADCLDFGCVGVAGCEAFEQSCADGQDNDGDGAADCADVDCYLSGCSEVIR